MLETPAQLFLGAPVVLVACGQWHTVALTMCGEVWSWGKGDDGRLGHGDTRSRGIPTRVRGDKAFSRSRIEMVAAGGGHTIAVADGGEMFTWGAGSFGRLGHKDEQGRLEPTQLVGEFRGSGLAMVAAGPSFTVAGSTLPPMHASHTGISCRAPSRYTEHKAVGTEHDC